MYDFENICRTCLSTDDLKHLFENCFESICVADMLMCITALKFTEDDGLPGKICINCSDEVNQAFLFAKRCEATDTVLRKCLKSKAELANNLSRSKNFREKEEIKIEIKTETDLPHHSQTVEELVEEYYHSKTVKREDDLKFDNEEVKLEEKVVIEYEENVGVQLEEDMKIENENTEIYDNPANESYKEDVDDDQDETYSEISEDSNSNSQVEEECFLAKRGNKYLLRSHPRQEPYTCKICNKSFSKSYNLKIHIRVHTGEKPYTCEVCSKTFCQSGHIKIHMRIHTGEKPYTCEVCSKTFSLSGNLKSHMKTHTREKPYTCEVCSKTFFQSSSLKNHMRIHPGEKPYTCEVCSKTFSRSGNFKTHMRTHTVEQFLPKAKLL